MGFQNKGLNLVDIELQKRFSKKETFLAKVDKVIKWGPINKILKEKYKKKMSAIGQPAYHPLSMFKILLLEVWYDLSDLAVEEALYDRLSFMKFTKLSITDSIPDHSTISRFRNALNTLGLYDKLFLILNQQLEQQKLLVKRGAIVDASVIQSSTRPRKVIKVQVQDRKEADIENSSTATESKPSNNTDSKEKNNVKKKKDEENPETTNPIEYSKDPDATWIVKGKKLTYGYKCHMAVDMHRGFIVGGHVTPANISDMNQLEAVLDESNLPAGIPILADKGYCSKKNRTLVNTKGFTDFIMYKKTRSTTLTPLERITNKLISKYRFKVEQGFGTLKRRFSFSRMRYIGLEKSHGDFMLKAMGFNILKAVRMVT